MLQIIIFNGRILDQSRIHDMIFPVPVSYDILNPL